MFDCKENLESIKGIGYSLQVMISDGVSKAYGNIYGTHMDGVMTACQRYKNMDMQAVKRIQNLARVERLYEMERTT